MKADHSSSSENIPPIKGQSSTMTWWKQYGNYSDCDNGKDPPDHIICDHSVFFTIINVLTVILQVIGTPLNIFSVSLFKSN